MSVLADRFHEGLPSPTSLLETEDQQKKKKLIIGNGEIIMKKIIALVLMAVMCLAVFSSCGDPLAADLERFINTDMTEVYENYEKIKAEAATWEDLADDAAFEASINDRILPVVNDSLDKLGKIMPETEKVRRLKDQYTKMMEEYKAGFEESLEGIRQADEAMLTSGNEKLSAALSLLDEYNASLEALADEAGLKVEY